MNGTTAEKMQYLNDVELSILASLVSANHCIFSSSTLNTLDLGASLESTINATFGIDAAVLCCTTKTTVDDFNDSLLRGNGIAKDGFDEARLLSIQRLTTDDSLLEQSRIANAIIITDLDRASDSVQVQVIELLRTKRIFTRSAMYTAPKDFLLIATLSQPESKLSFHLNDMVAMSQLSGPEDRRSVANNDSAFISPAEIEQLRLQASMVRLTAEVDAYLYDIVLYMRMSRFVQGGISATATRQMRALCKALAALHGIDFVTPSLVMLAARKIYPHRIVLATASTEMSLQWGSDPVEIQRLLDNTTIAEIVDDVMASVETPL